MNFDVSRSIALIAVVGCSTSTTPSTPPAPAKPAPSALPENTAAAPSTPVAPAACVAADGSLDWAAVRGTAIDACRKPNDENAPASCRSFHVAAPPWAPDSRPDQPTPPPTAPHAEATSATEVSVCTPAGACTPVELRASAPDPGPVAVTADGSLIAVVSGGKLARVYDNTGAKLRDVPSWVTGMSDGKHPATLQSVRFVGDSLALYVSTSPVSDDVRLFVPRTGKLLGEVKSGNGFIEDAPFDLGNHQYGFLELGKPIVHVVDATTATPIRDLQFGSGSGDDAPALAWVDALPDKNHVALDGTTAVVIQVATGAMTRVPAPACQH